VSLLAVDLPLCARVDGPVRTRRAAFADCSL